MPEGGDGREKGVVRNHDGEAGRWHSRRWRQPRGPLEYQELSSERTLTRTAHHFGGRGLVADDRGHDPQPGAFVRDPSPTRRNGNGAGRPDGGSRGDGEMARRQRGRADVESPV